MKYDRRTKALAVRMYRANKPITHIEAATGACAKSIRRWAGEAGCERRPSRRRGYDPRTRATAVRMYEAGASMLKIGAKTGADARTVRRWARDAGVELRPRHGILTIDLDALWDAFVKVGTISGAARAVGIPYGTAYHHLGRRSA